MLLRRNSGARGARRRPPARFSFRNNVRIAAGRARRRNNRRGAALARRRGHFRIDAGGRTNDAVRLRRGGRDECEHNGRCGQQASREQMGHWLSLPLSLRLANIPHLSTRRAMTMFQAKQNGDRSARRARAASHSPCLLETDRFNDSALCARNVATSPIVATARRCGTFATTTSFVSGI